jgi:hypothetical protein
MFLQTWKKYLPVITLLMKRQAGTEQVLAMNHTDFERAAGGRKVKYTFTDLLFVSGKPDIASKSTPLAKDLVVVLQEDETTRSLMKARDFEFTLKGGFQLLISIRDKEQPAPQQDETLTEEAAAEPADQQEG